MVKKICLIVIVMLLPAVSVSGAPVGNIADPVMLYRGVFSDERPYGLVFQLEYDWNTTRTFKNQISYDYEFSFATAKIGGMLRKSLFVYALFGMGQYNDTKTPWKYKTSEGVRHIAFETDPGFVYGAGATAIMYEKKVDEGVFFRVGLDAQYRRVEVEADDAELYLRSYHPAIPITRTDYAIPNTYYSLELDEYHVAVEVSYQIDDVVPYLGFRMSEGVGHEVIKPPGYTNYNDTNYDNSIKTYHNKGYIVGVTYYFFNKCSLGVEARLGDEDAVTLSTMVRF